MKELVFKKKVIILLTSLSFIFFCLVFLPINVEAKPSYATQATFCIEEYNYLESNNGGESALGAQVCCPNGAVPVDSSPLCRNQITNALVDSMDPKSRNPLTGPEICSDREYLVYSSGRDNYCLDQGEVVKGTTGGIGEGKVFAGCKVGLSPFTTTEFHVDGSQTQYALPGYCTGGGGLFVDDTSTCLCGDETAFPLEASTPACSTLCSQRGGVIFDGKELVNLANICNGPSCCNGDQECLTCVGLDENSVTGNIYTSLGCINPTRSGIVVWLIRVALILTSAIGVFRFIQASFLIRTGDPEKIKEGQEIVTSAIIALVLVLVSVPLLQFIGVNVLGIFPAGSF